MTIDKIDAGVTCPDPTCVQSPSLGLEVTLPLDRLPHLARHGTDHGDRRPQPGSQWLARADS
ncbi:hypothetical protein [Streptosporangium sp. NPDC001681]|uniref:hypothetical protein n=1 Tax=Streptosporangium sp. NPDC001681 TaxID=3154395 RepID=UPI00332B28B1